MTDQTPAPTTDKVGDFVQKFMPQMARVLPDFMTPDRMARVMVTQIRKTPKLAQCEKASLLQAMMQCAELGLEPGSALGHCYLIPYKGEATFLLGYQGMLELINRTGQVSSMSVNCVWKDDVFTWTLGDNAEIKHEPGPNYEGRDEDVTHVYLIAKMKDGSIYREVMTRQAIDKRMKRSASKGKGPWGTDWPAMAKKTVVRQAFKMLPKAIVPPTAHEALHAEDLADLASAEDIPFEDITNQEEAGEENQAEMFEEGSE